MNKRMANRHVPLAYVADRPIWEADLDVVLSERVKHIAGALAFVAVFVIAAFAAGAR